MWLFPATGVAPTVPYIDALCCVGTRMPVLFMVVASDCVTTPPRNSSTFPFRTLPYCITTSPVLRVRPKMSARPNTLGMLSRPSARKITSLPARHTLMGCCRSRDRLLNRGTPNSGLTIAIATAINRK